MGSITAAHLYDLITCDHRLWRDLHDGAHGRDPINPFVQLLWEKGTAYEEEVIGRLQQEFINLRFLGFDIPNGEGATFWVDFPIYKGEPNENLIEPARTEKKSQPAMGSKILHVEDDEDFSSLISAALPSEYEVISAKNIFIAKRHLKDQKFSLVLLDLTLPEGSGLPLVEYIRKTDPNLPVIILSAEEPPLDIQSKVEAVLIKSKQPEKKIIDTIVGTARVS